MISRITGLLWQEIYITRRSLEIIADTVWFSVINVLLFGFIAKYLIGIVNEDALNHLLLGIILWEALRINQYSLSLNPMWNIWSRNFSNLFISPLSKEEYLLAQMLSAYVKSLVVLFINAAVAIAVFDFNIFHLGLAQLLFYVTHLSLFAWSLGMVIMGAIFIMGTRIQALAWGLIYLFQPFMAVFFPVAVLPPVLQRVAFTLPPTYIFEAARSQLAALPVDSQLLTIASVLNIIYFITALFVFDRMFKLSQNRGQFAKNDEG